MQKPTEVKGILLKPKSKQNNSHASHATFNEANLLETYHPKNKDYGHMKIMEPPIPFNPTEEHGNIKPICINLDEIRINNGDSENRLDTDATINQTCESTVDLDNTDDVERTSHHSYSESVEDKIGNNGIKID